MTQCRCFESTLLFLFTFPFFRLASNQTLSASYPPSSSSFPPRIKACCTYGLDFDEYPVSNTLPPPPPPPCRNRDQQQQSQVLERRETGNGGRRRLIYASPSSSSSSSIRLPRFCKGRREGVTSKLERLVCVLCMQGLNFLCLGTKTIVDYTL